jgi:hypothetical protein
MRIRTEVIHSFTSPVFIARRLHGLPRIQPGQVCIPPVIVRGNDLTP